MIFERFLGPKKSPAERFVAERLEKAKSMTPEELDAEIATVQQKIEEIDIEAAKVLDSGMSQLSIDESLRSDKARMDLFKQVLKDLETLKASRDGN